MTLDLAFAVGATGAHVYHLFPDGSLGRDELRAIDLQRQFSGMIIDSRAAVAGSFFVALPGERVDGHNFIAEVFVRGALAALARQDSTDQELSRWLSAAPDGSACYILAVPDTARALQAIGACWRARHDVTVVGVTGSIGKTTTKEIIAGVLEQCYSVLKSEGNLNSEIGLPVVLSRLTSHHQLAVLEMGMYLPGDIRLLAEVARPRIGVVTNVAPVHLERVGSIERIARSKSELVAALPANGLAVLNGDNPWTRAMAESSGIARSVLVGFGKHCQYRAVHVRAEALEGVTFTLEAEGLSVPIATSLPGTHLVHAVLMAAAVARELDMSWEAIVTALGQVRAQGRQQLIAVRGDLLVIDDSYNAAPMSMDAALSLLRAAEGSKIAVLGDMLELGREEEMAHRDVGRHAAQAADWLVVRGPRAAWIADEAQRAGLPGTHIRHAQSNLEAAHAVLDIVSTAPARKPTASRSADDAGRWVVLVKGSRGMGMEEVVNTLRDES